MTTTAPSEQTLTRQSVFRQHRVALDCVRSSVPDGKGYPRHQHDFSELVIVLEGEAQHVTQTDRFPISAGSVFVLHPGEPHAYQQSHQLLMANIMFRREELPLLWSDVSQMPGFHTLFTLEPNYRRNAGNEGQLTLDTDQLAQLSVMLQHLDDELSQRDPGWITAAMAHFALIVTTLCRAYSHTQHPIARQLLRVGEVVGHIETNLDEEYSLQAMADMANLSPRGFTRLFRQLMGTSPIDYLIRKRMERAAELLMDPKLGNNEVAHMVGLSDGNYLARQFRRIYGCSPRAYQRNRRG